MAPDKRGPGARVFCSFSSDQRERKGGSSTVSSTMSSTPEAKNTLCSTSNKDMDGHLGGERVIKEFGVV